MSTTVNLLRALPVDRGCIRTRALAVASGIPAKTVSNRMRVLIGRGLAEAIKTGCYRLTTTGAAMRDAPMPIKSGPRGQLTQAARRPQRRTFQDRAWWLLRRERRSTLGNILAMIGERCCRSGVRRFMTALWQAGYVEIVGARAPGTAPSSNGFLQYLLVRDTGAGTPIVQRKRGRVWDPNEQQAYPLARAGNPRGAVRGAGAWGAP